MTIAHRVVAGQYASLVSSRVDLPKGSPILFHIAGTGEDGPADGTSLDLLYNNGPLKLINQGSDRFTELTVVGIQLPVGKYDLPTLDQTIAAILQETGADQTQAYIAGLSAGAGALMGLLTRLPRAYAAALAIAPASYPGLTAKSSAKRLWIWQNDQDPTVTPTWTTGGDSTLTPTWDTAWMTALSGRRCLDTHPDKPTCLTHSGGPKLNGVTSTALAVMGANEWTWARASDTVAPGGTLAILLRKAAVHGGWDEAWAQPTMIDWLLGPKAIPVVVPPPPLTYTITQSQMDAINVATSQLISAVKAIQP